MDLSYRYQGVRILSPVYWKVINTNGELQILHVKLSTQTRWVGAISIGLVLVLFTYFNAPWYFIVVGIIIGIFGIYHFSRHFKEQENKGPIAVWDTKSNAMIFPRRGIVIGRDSLKEIHILICHMETAEGQSKGAELYMVFASLEKVEAVEIVASLYVESVRNLAKVLSTAMNLPVNEIDKTREIDPS